MARISKTQAQMLPHDEGAERTVIGSLLIDPDALIRAQEIGLAASDFWDHRLGWIYAAAETVAARRLPVEYGSIARQLESEADPAGDRLQAVGGDLTLTALMAETATTIHAGYYAGIVRRDARRRQLIAAAAEVAVAAHAHDGELGDLYDAVSQIVFGAMARSDTESHLYGGSAALRRYLDTQKARAERLARNRDAMLKTYWSDVDRLIGEFQPGQLVIIGASTSVGKTMAMEQIAEANARRGHRVAFYHLELSHQSMLDRCIARCSGIDTRRLREGYDGQEVVDAMAEIHAWHAHISLVHSPGWTAERIAADITRLHALGRCDLAVVDYLQKVAAPEGTSSMNSAQVVGQKVEVMKNMAERLGIPVVLGSQVSRFYKATAEKRPTVDDLRDSGEIAEKANIVLMLHNPTPREDRRDDQKTELIELHVEKNTDGPLGMAKLVHVKGRFLLGDVAPEPDQPWDKEREIPF